MAQRFELIHRGGAINVHADQQGAAPLFQQQLGEFGAGGGFARSVQPHHQDGGGTPFELKAFVFRSEQGGELVRNDFDDLLAGLDALEDLLADRLLFDLVDEPLGDLKVDIRIEQRHAHLAEGVADV